MVNPARAGMIRGKFYTVDGAEGKPRASGDDPDAAYAADVRRG